MRIRKNDGETSGIETTNSVDYDGNTIDVISGFNQNLSEYMYYDYLHSLRFVTDGTGALKAAYDYYPYGSPIYTLTKDDTETDPTFATHSQDEESGHYYAKQRYYDPESGRFNRLDPAQDGNNWYVYCGGDPVNKIDPWGLWGKKVHFYDISSDDPLQISTLNIAMDLIGFSAACILAAWDINRDLTEGLGLIYGEDSVFNNWRHFNGNKGTLEGSEGDSRMQYAEKQMQKAVNLYNQGKIEEAYKQLGYGLHSLQDIFAHWGFEKSHVGVEGVDDPTDKRNIVGLAMTAIVTMDYILDFLERTGQDVVLSQKNMNILINSFKNLLEYCLDPNQFVQISKAKYLLANLKRLINRLKNASNANDPEIQQQIEELEDILSQIETKLESGSTSNDNNSSTETNTTTTDSGSTGQTETTGSEDSGSSGNSNDEEETDASQPTA